MSAVYSRIIRLSSDDMAEAGLVGIGRHQRALARHRSDPENPSRDPGTYQGDDILGARGELAVAIAFGVPWNPSVELDDHVGDVVDRHGGAWYVKATTYDRGHLILKDKDACRQVPFALVTLNEAWATLRGWVVGDQAAQPRYRRARPRGGGQGGYWIPQRDLRPFDLVPA